MVGSREGQTRRREFLRGVGRAYWIALGFALLNSLVGNSQCFGYDDDGHFYTLAALGHSHHPALDGARRKQAIVAAFCAEMPDLAKELDAYHSLHKAPLVENPSLDVRGEMHLTRDSTHGNGAYVHSCFHGF
jgi:hypothetical protein